MANASVPTFSGRTILWKFVKALTSTTEPKNIGWGDSTVTSSQFANVNLFKPQTEARTAGTSTLTTVSYLADTYQVLGTIINAVATKTITEAGLFDVTTLSPTTTVSVSMTNAQVSLSIGAVGSFPTSGNYYIQVENETMLVSGANTTSLTVVRGRLGSTSAAHASGVPITLGGDGTNNTPISPATTEQTATVGASVGGNMFAHADFAGIGLNISDAIAFTWTDQLT
jgi:hypothetical protein